jgi:hypothetical protein
MKMLDEYFKELASDNGRNEGGFFRPSGISQCARLNLYHYLNVAPFVPPDIRSMKLMTRGTLHHAAWAKIFKDAKIKTIGGDNVETLITMKNPTIAGHYDFVVVSPDGEKLLIEWKSTQSRYENISWEHNVQWTLYAHMLEIKRGYLVKEEPASFNPNPISMTYDGKFAKGILDWLIMTESAAKNREMLDFASECGPGMKWKKTCDIYDFCHSELGNNPWNSVKWEELK